MSAGSDVRAARGSSPWWQALARRVREKDARRQLRYDRGRKAIVRTYLESRARAALPPLLRDYLEQLAGAVVAFWLIGALLSLLRAQPWYTYGAFGLFYSLQSTYYTYRLARDPGYRIPRCRCAGRARDASEVVLGSRASVIPSVPNAVAGVLLYLALGGLIVAGHTQAAALLAALAVGVSAYLGYVMVFRIEALCSNCISLAALNLLLVWQLLR